VKLDFPRPGEVIRYSFLWHREQLSGREEGSKERPCIVVAANPRTRRVWVVPVTHTWPGKSSIAVKIPAATKMRLSLDDDESWMILDEVNEFDWPGPDLRSVPGKSPASCSYGLLPASLYITIRDHLKKLVGQNKISKAKRTN
jgi:mRNA-degrading endonuclease toxin of MazEF toxin-antitoxin module